jgi:hypothetical protein
MSATGSYQNAKIMTPVRRPHWLENPHFSGRFAQNSAPED